MRLKRKEFYNEARTLKHRTNIPYRQAKRLIGNPKQIEAVVIDLVSRQMKKDLRNFEQDVERMQREARRADYSQKGTTQGLWKQLFENGRDLG